MCHTAVPQEMPLNVPGGAAIPSDFGAQPSPDFSSGGAPSALPGGMGPTDELGQSLDAARKPTTVQVKKPTKFGRVLELASGGAYDPTGGEDTTLGGPGGKPTKFGALLNIVRPMLQG